MYKRGLQDEDALLRDELFDRLHAEEVERQAYAAKLTELRRRREEVAAAEKAASPAPAPAGEPSGEGPAADDDDDDDDDAFNWRRRGL
jgi:hypothetical protein